MRPTASKHQITSAKSQVHGTAVVATAFQTDAFRQRRSAPQVKTRWAKKGFQ
jgi:hypothetical protein